MQNLSRKASEFLIFIIFAFSIFNASDGYHVITNGKVEKRLFAKRLDSNTGNVLFKAAEVFGQLTSYGSKITREKNILKDNKMKIKSLKQLAEDNDVGVAGEKPQAN